MKLFEPGRIGSLEVKNRIVMAPMGVGGLVEPDGRLSNEGIDYFEARAKGGVGMVVTCNSRVSREIEQVIGTAFVRNMMLDSNIYTGRLSRLADALHDHGTKVAVLSTAGFGRVAGHEFLRSVGAVAPSPQPCFFDPKLIARELTTQEVERLAKGFEFAGELLRSAGIDAIMLHGHEGYLFDQFMTPLWNKRKDKYGGDLDGRLRFSIEVIEALKRGAGKDFPVIYRFGLTHYLPGGREIEEGLEIARRLEAAGVDALDVDAGCYETWYWAHPPTTQPPGCLVDLAAMTKKVVKIPVMAVGKLGYPDLAEKVLQNGEADFIILGRPLLADPEWANKVRENRADDIRPCVGDHICIERILGRKYIGCSVNPQTGMEKQLEVTPAPKRKSVLVVGGGPAGMEAARVAALRGHKVTLWEKKRVLGGNLVPASAPDFKEDYRRLIAYLSGQVKKLGVKVEMGREATPALVKKSRPDVVFVATGSTPVIPQLPGVTGGRVVTAIDALVGRGKVGKCAVVLGGGAIGCETALYLARKGKAVTVVEMLDKVACDMYLANRMHLLKLLDEAKVKVLCDTKALEVTADGVKVRGKAGRSRVLDCDTVVLAVGLRPDNSLLQALQGKLPEVYAIGDCVEPRKVLSAIWEGYRKARLV